MKPFHLHVIGYLFATFVIWALIIPTCLSAFNTFTVWLGVFIAIGWAYHSYVTWGKWVSHKLAKAERAARQSQQRQR